MNSPPYYRPLIQPGDPCWRNWWLALLFMWAVPFVALLALWPEAHPRQKLWLWSAVAPLLWAMVVSLRFLGWRLALFEMTTYRRTRAAHTLRWWRRRQLSLPVQEVLLLGPAGDEQANYQQLMAQAPAPLPVALPGSIEGVLRCPVALPRDGQRGVAVARHLARLTLALPAINEHWPSLRGIAWAGCAASQAAFEQALADAGAVLPVPRMPLNTMAELDTLIDAFTRECRNPADWLLCAGVASLEQAPNGQLPGEGGFVWWVVWHGRMRLHRGESLPADVPEIAAQACMQVQRYAGLDSPPPECVAIGTASQKAFVNGGWPVAEHQLAAHWGELAGLASFIGMSLAMLQAGETRQACGWLSQCDDQQVAIGMAVPYGD